MNITHNDRERLKLMYDYDLFLLFSLDNKIGEV